MHTFQSGNVIYGAFTCVNEANQDLTLKQLIDEWNQNVNFVRNSKTTWSYTANIQRHILGYFTSSYPVKEMSSKTITAYLTSLKTEKNLGNNTVNKHRTHLMTLFEYIIENEDNYGIETNPVKRVRALKPEPYLHHIYQPEEAKDLMESLKNSGHIGLETAVAIALYCGCRREEVCALRWENVNMQKRYMTICEVRTTAGKEVVKMNHTKNNTIRQIGIPDALYEIFERARQEQQFNKRKKDSLYHTEYDFVVSEPDGSPWHPNNVTRRWSRYIKDKGFRYIRYHDLRHTNLSLLMTKMSAVDVATLGGHKKVSTTTNIYGHSFNNALAKGVEAMNELL